MTATCGSAIESSLLADILLPERFRVDRADIDIFQRLLRDFVPPNAYDAHVHCYELADLGLTQREQVVGYETLVASQDRWMGSLHPRDALLFPFPSRQIDVPASNRRMLDQLRCHERCRGLLLIRPDDDPQAIEQLCSCPGVAGFKVYHCYSRRSDTFNAEPSEYIPDWAWELAHQKGLAIMLHLVLPTALADERNQRYIRARCKDWPDAKLILAHAARGFCACHTVDGIDGVRGLANLYFDTSVICDATAMEAIIRAYGARRLLYGSDFPVSEIHGRPVSTGDGFYWLYESNAQWDDWSHGRLTLCGIESLLAVQHACRHQGLTDADVERIFRDNAHALFGLH